MENIESSTVTETTQDAADRAADAVDAAIAAALSRKAAKASATPKAPAEPKRPRLSDEEKKARSEKLEADRAERKVARDAARAAKLAARATATATRPAHLAKVQAAAQKLGSLSPDAQLIFNDATTNLSAAELTVLAGHIAHFNRENSTLRALDSKLEAGQRVTVTGGDPRYIGQTGAVSKVARIRCYVQLDGVEKVGYFFTSDVSPHPAEAVEVQAEAV